MRRSCLILTSFHCHRGLLHFYRDLLLPCWSFSSCFSYRFLFCPQRLPSRLLTGPLLCLTAALLCLTAALLCLTAALLNAALVCINAALLNAALVCINAALFCINAALDSLPLSFFRGRPLCLFSSGQFTSSFFICWRWRVRPQLVSV